MKVMAGGHQLFRAIARRAVGPSSNVFAKRAVAASTARQRRPTTSKLQPWRPSLDDVTRLSEGRAAKTRGAGSRQVPHRLNAEEVKLFKLAKEKGFLTIKGSGYRRERKGSPLANIYRQWCDATAAPCILVEQDASGGLDTVLVDLSPLRTTQLEEEEEACAGAGAELGYSPADPAQLRSPFTVDLLPEAAAVAIPLAGPAAASGQPAGEQELEVCPQLAPPPAAAAAAAAAEAASSGEEAVLAAAPDVAGFSGALRIPAAPRASSSTSDGGSAPNVKQPAATPLMLTAPIWRQQPRLVGFKAERAAAKGLAKALSSALARLGKGRA